jgi:hypothetical protein
MTRDAFNPQFPLGGYSATHKGNRDLDGQMTPNFEIMEGVRFGDFQAAMYLPSVRYENVFQDQIVIAAGKPVALDSNNRLVPAGFRHLLELGAGNGPQYSQLDINLGVTNALGQTPAVGEYVIDSMIAADMTVGRILGVASYDVYMSSGADTTNPATYRFHNYSRQSSVAVLTDYLLEYPIEPYKRTQHKIESTLSADAQTFDLEHEDVLEHTVRVRINGRRDVDFDFEAGAGANDVDQLQWDTVDYLKDGDVVEVEYFYETVGEFDAPWASIASWRGDVQPGDFVTIDANSHFVKYEHGAIGDTSAGNEAAAIQGAISKALDIVGQVTLVDDQFPKQFLDRVKTAYDDRLTGPIKDGRTGELSRLDRLPGSATDGAPHNVHYAGGDVKTGIVRFNMNIT